MAGAASSTKASLASRVWQPDHRGPVIHISLQNTPLALANHIGLRKAPQWGITPVQPPRRKLSNPTPPRTPVPQARHGTGDFGLPGRPHCIQTELSSDTLYIPDSLMLVNSIHLSLDTKPLLTQELPSLPIPSLRLVAGSPKGKASPHGSVTDGEVPLPRR